MDGKNGLCADNLSEIMQSPAYDSKHRPSNINCPNTSQGFTPATLGDNDAGDASSASHQHYYAPASAPPAHRKKALQRKKPFHNPVDEVQHRQSAELAAGQSEDHLAASSAAPDATVREVLDGTQSCLQGPQQAHGQQPGPQKQLHEQQAVPQRQDHEQGPQHFHEAHKLLKHPLVVLRRTLVQSDGGAGNGGGGPPLQRSSAPSIPSASPHSEALTPGSASQDTPLLSPRSSCPSSAVPSLPPPGSMQLYFQAMDSVLGGESQQGAPVPLRRRSSFDGSVTGCGSSALAVAAATAAADAAVTAAAAAVAASATPSTLAAPPVTPSSESGRLLGKMLSFGGMASPSQRATRISDPSSAPPPLMGSLLCGAASSTNNGANGGALGPDAAAVSTNFAAAPIKGPLSSPPTPLADPPGLSTSMSAFTGATSAVPPAASAASVLAAVPPPLHLPVAEPLQSFFDYLRAEARPAEKRLTTDVVWGQTERDKVYNFILHVPYQLERLITFGLLLCIDSFLVFDLLCMGILVIATCTLRAIKPGFIYYWMKDITSEFLKMSVLSSAFEIADKILNNFGVDVLEALSGTCTQWAAGSKRGLHVAADASVALVIVVMHAVVLMCQALVLAVAMSSRRNGLLALLIANNFVEIKGSVFKRWDMPRIYALVCADVVERFHLMAVLLFVAVEEMDSSATPWPSRHMVMDCVRVLGSEIVIDILKHAVLGKFNDVRPGIYREFMRDLCEGTRTAQSHQLPKLLSLHHLGSAALVLRTGATIFWLRSGLAATSSSGGGSSGSSSSGGVPRGGAGGGSWGGDLMADAWAGELLGRFCKLALVWAALVVLKPLLGFGCKVIAHHYIKYYNSRYLKMHLPGRNPSAVRQGSTRAVGAPAQALSQHPSSQTSGFSGGGALHTKFD